MNSSEAKGSTLPEGPIENARFGRYQLVERVGKGGMAEVFRATTSWAAGVAKEVCIKRILPPLSSDERMREMFIQEARIAASLTHANIVPVYEFGIIDTYYFLSMEFVDGKTVRDIMMQAARHKQWLGVPVVLHIVHEVLEGLDYAHRKRDSEGDRLNIVHRDVTPGNVMISKEGEVKLLDFGIAVIGEAETGKKIGRGKPGYIAPEQLVGMATDPRADIYAVGVIAYEMLTHQRLFKQKTVEERLQKTTSIVAPSKLNSLLPPALDGLLLRALEPKADQRYRSAAAFRDAVGDFMHTRGVRAGRSQVARGLAELFGGDSDFDPAERSVTDLRAFDEEAELARQPRRQRVTRSTRTISSNQGAPKLDAAMESARKARIKALWVVVLAALVAGLAALVWLLP